MAESLTAEQGLESVMNCWLRLAMNPESLNQFLHARIPLSAHMGMEVLSLDRNSVRIQIPRARNLNPHSGVFGGSLSGLGLVCGWAVVYIALNDAGLDAKLVGQRSECEFLKPAAGDCVGEARCEDAEIARFMQQIRKVGMARLTVKTTIRSGNIEVAHHEGVYAAVPES